MSNVLRIALVDPNDASRESLKGMLLSRDTIWLEADCSRYEFFPDVIEQTAPDVGIIALDANMEQAIGLIQRLSVDAPETAILAASESTDGHLILQAIRAGAREFLTLPVSGDDLADALGRVSQQKFGSSDSSGRACQVIAVAGATGGVGTTSTAVNLGCILADDPHNSVALVDLDLALGDADVFLDSIPDYTLADVVHNVSRLDIQLLKRSLTKHSSGLYLLPRPVELHDTLSITEDSIRKVVSRRTRAIIAVHLAGWPCQMDPILELARAHGSAVVFLTRKGPEAPSLSTLATLRLTTRRERLPEPGRFRCVAEALKDKRRGPGWQFEEVFHAPTGLR